MALKTSNRNLDNGAIICFEDYQCALMARRRELGAPEIARNSGANRTPGKQDLIAAIKALGGNW